MAALRAGLITVAILLGLGFAVAQQDGKNLSSPQQKGQQEKAQQTESGRAGTTEPGSHTPTAPADPSWAFQDGRLIAPGAPADGQTVPSKFSERNKALDGLPTMAFPLPLTDDQRQRIRDAVGKTPEAVANARPAELLPNDVEMRALPDQITAEIPAVRNLSYVRTSGGVLLISPANRIVVGEIAAQGAAK